MVRLQTTYICAQHPKHQTDMIKKFALVATVAALFVACSSEDTGAMEEKAQTDANAQEMLDAAAADAEVVVAPETTEAEEVVIEETEAPAEGVEAETEVEVEEAK